MNRGLFAPAKYKEYADLISFKDVESARRGIKKLKELYNKAGPIKRRRIKRVVIYTINRINASLKRKSLKKETKQKLITILKMFRDLYKKL